jgi:hypothetical protein
MADRLDIYVGCAVDPQQGEGGALGHGFSMRLHHSFDDPAALDDSKGRTTEFMRRVRNELRHYLGDCSHHDFFVRDGL